MASWLLWTALFGAPAARAQRAFVLEHFEPVPTQERNIMSVGTTNLLPHRHLSVGVLAHASDNTLVQLDTVGNVTAELVDFKFQADAWIAVGLFDLVEMGVAAPIVAYQEGDDQTALGFPGEQIDGSALGDLRLIGKVLLLSPQKAGGFGIAAQTALYLPTGDEKSFNSFGELRVEPRLLLDWRSAEGFRVAFNVGYQKRPRELAINLVSDDVIRWGLGVEIPTPVDGLAVQGTIFGDRQLDENRDFTNPLVPRDDGKGEPMEILLGVRWAFARSWSLSGGVGTGLSRGFGAPDWRLYSGLSWTPGAVDFTPTDADGDGYVWGLFDRIDKCPDLPEDFDGFQDGDGCPEPDNDRDGIRDNLDWCPVEPEDLDGFEDEDGCADPDNDGDRIPDAKDACPMKAEDLDGFEDEDGCPEPDNDQDGVPDVLDRCPNEPEDLDEFEDTDGCPEAGGERVYVTAHKAVALEPILFAPGRDRILPRSFSLLEEVAETLKANPQILKVRVDGHTDATGPEDYNQVLSEARAEAVRKFLIGRGVAPERLEAAGFGESAPIADNGTEAGRGKNRRVEFTILEQVPVAEEVPADESEEPPAEEVPASDGEEAQ